MPSAETIQSPAEEIANSITHGVGAALAVVALALLLASAARQGTARHLAGAASFGATLVILYSTSTLYHAIAAPRAKRLFDILDHSAIYLLIAGTYTPLCLITLRGAWGWSLFWIIWGLAAAGITLQCLFTLSNRLLSTAAYVGMGLLALVAIRPLCHNLAAGGLLWLAGGVLCYCLGTAFYLNHGIRFAHAVWHLFVLGGSACHVMAVLGSVITGR
ncbi:MAG: hemolysin III family protein [Holophaga sp.]|nr:hemolysin III family protein [Holophaga sp.]